MILSYWSDDTNLNFGISKNSSLFHGITSLMVITIFMDTKNRINKKNSEEKFVS